jgi:hypothetical protein
MSGLIRTDRMKDEPPIGADENGIPIMYATLEEAKAASTARKITGSEDPRDMSRAVSAPTSGQGRAPLGATRE